MNTQKQTASRRRILHVTEYCHAGSLGGTERYIQELVMALPADDWHNTILWLCGSKCETARTVDGVQVLPLSSPGSRVDPASKAFEGRAEAALDGGDGPDLVHFHTFGLAEAAIARIAARRGIPYVFTYHSPAWSCRRETLLIWGRRVCDGAVHPLRCSACKLQERLGCPPGVAYLGAMASAAVPAVISERASGKLRRRTAFVADTRRFRNALRGFLGAASRTVACCEWSRPVLSANGAEAGSIVLCPQGVPERMVRAQPAPAPPPADDKGLFVVGYIGRLTPVKGIHILVEAFCRTACPSARLRLFTTGTSSHVAPYERRIRRMAETDPRVEMFPPKSFDEMTDEYRHLSLVAIPSVWLETGPMVLFEALQLGVPVWGSEQIGQIELLRRRGRLIDPNTPDAWARALTEAFDLQKKGRWRTSSGQDAEPVRSMRDVAGDMVTQYRALVGLDSAEGPYA